MSLALQLLAVVFAGILPLGLHAPSVVFAGAMWPAHVDSGASSFTPTGGDTKLDREPARGRVRAMSSQAAATPFRQRDLTVPRGTTRLLPQLSRSTVDDVLASSARLKGRTPEGARAIAKKLGRAQREGFTSAFEGIQPTQANAEAIIRGTLTNPSSVAVRDKFIDVFNATGQGVRIDKATNTFVGFLEQGLVRP